ncbi:hypothetical protein [Caldivirga maquilingensis]|uniref:Uncharacterized protein n=1 Tax=Caldivirga maquilingensis (strain ATCC 700844 / DSM 13496 / JCM 10307 / IC-167) TaxID=397948 RepID=A8MBA8_CALMQ|nr:hypothetical protein [Caldivirga maquilingensis]ABW01198.1 hypothetical protein Cmaq_0352 [Caldivirga maquilingensis IC-167]
MMPINVNEIIGKLINEIRNYGQVTVEDYGSEKLIMVKLTEDFSVFISILCEDTECNVEYAVGDENFTIMPKDLDLIDKAVEVMRIINSALIKMGVVK